MEIKKASMQDLEQIMHVYKNARKFMCENGNEEQWGDDYPSTELIREDIFVVQRNRLPVSSTMQ